MVKKIVTSGMNRPVRRRDFLKGAAGLAAADARRRLTGDVPDVDRVAALGAVLGADVVGDARAVQGECLDLAWHRLLEDARAGRGRAVECDEQQAGDGECGGGSPGRRMAHAHVLTTVRDGSVRPG